MTSTPLPNSRFVASAEELGALAVPLLTSGVVIGRDERSALVPAPLFGPEARLAALVGNWWGLGMLVFRSLAVGARVVVSTSATDFWNNLGTSATGRAGQVQAVAGPVTLPPGSATEPVLHVVDVSHTGPSATAGAALGPWQTRLSAVFQLTPATMSELRTARVAILQRLLPAEAGYASDALRLTGVDLSPARHLGHDMFALVDRGNVRYVWTMPTSVEQQIFGPAPARI